MRLTLSCTVSTITIATTGTSHKEASIGIPSNFIPMGVAVTVTAAAAKTT